MIANLQSSRRRIFLATLSGVMLGCSFPPIPSGILAVCCFVPFLILFDSLIEYGEVVRYSYLTFFIFNVIALYWTGGFTHAKDIYLMLAGGMLLLVHPFFFSVPIVALMFIRRHLGIGVALMAFPLVWVSFEYLHSLFEIGFPWLTVGNTQTYDLSVVQIASYTGVYGISFWLTVLNVLGHFLYSKLAGKKWKISSLQSVATLLAFVSLYALPRVYGDHVLVSSPSPVDTKINVGCIQPNIDPFEKWQGNAEMQLGVLQHLTKEGAQKQVDLLLWPETAVPFYILHPNNRQYLYLIKNQVDSLGINLLTGIPDVIFYHEGDPFPRSSKISPSGQRYDTFNSSILIEPHRNEIQKYAKIILVPFAERVPFSEALSFLNAMQWNFGLGGWAHGKDTTVFHFKTAHGDSISFSNMVCYESVYPGLVAAFVRRGAQFLTVITNDSWWGNTSGTYQHVQFGVLRAIENHRWVIQCANGGISCIIDPFGHILQRTEMYTQAALVGTIEPQVEVTFYTMHGDWLAELTMLLSVFLLAASLGRKFYNQVRLRELREVH
ncbi:MAG: apolipoprotein N-acyltransferase [Ignavibacteria bacterium]|nr:apolipoprotein N-acyltransferase [Ignavibacteria bacterium]